jgi:hypothetical protein
VLRVTLLDVTPAVWRIVRMPSAIPLSVAHTALQVAMGWEDRHLHEWEVGEKSFGPPGDDTDADLVDETEVLVGDVAPPDSSLLYIYDFGDYWEHMVEVLAVEPYDGTVPPLAVLEGARACPPEDCGGPHGYADLLAALDNPDDLEHADMVTAYGDYLDPDVFDRELVNRRLEQLWRPAL